MDTIRQYPRTPHLEGSQTHWLDRPIVPNGLGIPVEYLYLPQYPGKGD